MDYETSDGSQVSLREIFEDRNGRPVFKAASISAFVDGKAFAGKAEHRIKELDDVSIVDYLKPVPTENIHPLFPTNFTVAPSFDLAEHYLKAPAFTYEDCKPGRTFVADCLLNEATALEKLSKHPHPNIVEYFGCIVKDARITQLCLKRYFCSLADYAEHRVPDSQREKIFHDVSSAAKHLHSLGLAHNDISPENVCIDNQGNAAIIDFDSCLPVGQRLVKGTSADGVPLLSDPNNDIERLGKLRDFLADLKYDEDDVTSGPVDGASEDSLLQHNISQTY
ncbi:hypothetical protein LTR95_016260 [Oleoguttula sp. CCFEE 5521]